MAEQATTFAAVGDTSRAFPLAGPYFVWRGAGDGDLALEIRSGEAGTWRPTGDVLSAEAVWKDAAPYSGRVQYRLRCTRLAAGATIGFEVLQ